MLAMFHTSGRVVLGKGLRIARPRAGEHGNYVNYIPRRGVRVVAQSQSQSQSQSSDSTRRLIRVDAPTMIRSRAVTGVPRTVFSAAVSGAGVDGESSPTSEGRDLSRLWLQNTMTRKKEVFVPRDPAGKKVQMYVCGVTVKIILTSVTRGFT